MSAAYYITLSNPHPGFDPFVNGKAIAREAETLSQLASALGLKSADEFVSMSPEEAASMAKTLGVTDDVQAPPEQWFSPDEGLAWVRQLHKHISAHPHKFKNAQAILLELAEYDALLSKAKSIDAKWHFSVDF